MGCRFPKLQSLDMNLQLRYQTLIVDPKLVLSEDSENEHDDFNGEKL